MGNKKLVIGYIRVSTIEQVDIGQSLQRQRELIEQYCRQRDWTNVQIISDEGQSGYKDNRKGFQKLKDLCSKGKVAAVIVTDLSRLSRSLRSTLEFIEDVITKQDIDFISITQQLDTKSPMGKAFLAITSVFAQLYRDEIQYKTKIALKHKRARGEKVGRFTEYGYDDVDGRLVENQVEQANIQLMAEWRQQGFTLAAIAEALHSKGIASKNGSKWYSSTVKSILDRRLAHVR